MCPYPSQSNNISERIEMCPYPSQSNTIICNNAEKLKCSAAVPVPHMNTHPFPSQSNTSSNSTFL